MSTPAPPSYRKFRNLFLLGEYAGTPAKSLFNDLILRLEHLENSPLSIRDPEEIKPLSYIQPWALESIENFAEFERAIRLLIDANAFFDPLYFRSLESCRAFILSRHDASAPQPVAADQALSGQLDFEQEENVHEVVLNSDPRILASVLNRTAITKWAESIALNKYYSLQICLPFEHGRKTQIAALVSDLEVRGRSQHSSENFRQLFIDAEGAGHHLVQFLHRLNEHIAVQLTIVPVSKMGRSGFERFLKPGWKSLRPSRMPELSGQDFETASRHESVRSD